MGRMSTPQPDPLVFLDNATVIRPGGEVALRGLSWTAREGETWAVVGPVGAGKTTLAEVLVVYMGTVSNGSALSVFCTHLIEIARRSVACSCVDHLSYCTQGWAQECLR